MSVAVKHTGTESPNLIITFRKLTIKAQPISNLKVTVAIRTSSKELVDSSNDD